MLTKDDFSKLKRLIRDEVEAEGKTTRLELSHDIRTTKMELSLRIDSISSRVKDLEISNQKIITEISKIRKNLKDTSNFLDKDNLKTAKRVRALEVRLGIPSTEVI